MTRGALGIDFGTATTVVAFAQEGKSEVAVDPASAVVRDPADPALVPTFVSFHPNGKTLAGRVAKARRGLDAVNTAHSFKRIVGLKAFHSAVKAFRKWYHADLEESADGLPVFKTRAGAFTAGELATFVFAHLREQESIATAGNGVVVTVPPSFASGQGEAIKLAAQAAGFANVRLLSEAYAAALPYVVREAGDRIVVVYDLGGGTFDAALLRCTGRDHELLAFGGDPYLGGDDVDLKLADWVVNEVLAAHRWDLRSELDRYKKLVWACEQTKVRLSSADEVELLLTQVDPILAGKTVLVQREYLEKHLYDLARRSFVICDEVLQAAGMTAQDVDQVILSGGGGYIPYIRDAVEKYFGKQPLSDLPPDKLVAMGASLAAESGIGS